MSSASPEFWHRRNDRVGNILSLTALTSFANCPHGFRLGRCVLHADFSIHFRPPEDIALGINMVGGGELSLHQFSVSNRCRIGGRGAVIRILREWIACV